MLVSAFLMESLNGAPFNAEELKKHFSVGEHELEKGVRFRITYDGVPDDAVVSAPEKDPEFLAYRYHIISDQFDTSHRRLLLPLCERA